MSKHKAELAAAIVTALGGQELCSCTGCKCVYDEAHAEKLVEAIAPAIARIAGEDAAAAIAADLKA